MFGMNNQQDVRMGHLFASRFPPAGPLQSRPSMTSAGSAHQHGSAELRRLHRERSERERSPHNDRDESNAGRRRPRVNFTTGPVTSEHWQEQIDSLTQRVNALDRTQRDQALTIGRLREYAQSQHASRHNERIDALGDYVDRRFAEAGHRVEHRIRELFQKSDGFMNKIFEKLADVSDHVLRLQQQFDGLRGSRPTPPPGVDPPRAPAADQQSARPDLDPDAHGNIFSPNSRRSTSAPAAEPSPTTAPTTFGPRADGSQPTNNDGFGIPSPTGAPASAPTTAGQHAGEDNFAADGGPPQRREPPIAQSWREAVGATTASPGPPRPEHFNVSPNHRPDDDNRSQPATPGSPPNVRRDGAASPNARRSNVYSTFSNNEFDNFDQVPSPPWGAFRQDAPRPQPAAAPGYGSCANNFSDRKFDHANLNNYDVRIPKKDTANLATFDGEYKTYKTWRLKLTDHIAGENESWRHLLFHCQKQTEHRIDYAMLGNMRFGRSTGWDLAVDLWNVVSKRLGTKIYEKREKRVLGETGNASSFGGECLSSSRVATR